MPYCDLAIKVKENSTLTHVVSCLAKEAFSAIEAHKLTSDMWNIDAGENDIRAVISEEDSIIRLFCRYDNSRESAEKKITSFCLKHSDIVELSTV